MKRFGFILVVLGLFAGRGGMAESVPLSALGLDTQVETMPGEVGGGVRLVSKAKLNLMLEAIAIGSEDVWMDLSGSTGLIYQIVRNTGVVGSRDKMIVTSVSVDFESVDHSISNGSVITADAPMQYFWRGRFDEGSYGLLINSDQKTVTATFGNFFDAYFGVTSTSQLSAPYTLSALGSAATGSFTVDWYGVTTNVYQVATLDDVQGAISGKLDKSGGTMTGPLKLAESGVIWQGVNIATNFTIRAEYDGTNVSFNVYTEAK